MLVSLPAPSKRIGEEPTAWNRPRYFPSSLLLLVSVEYGGWSLLGFLTGRGQLGSSRSSSSGQSTPMPESCWCLGSTRSGRLRLRWGRALGPRLGGTQDQGDDGQGRRIVRKRTLRRKNHSAPGRQTAFTRVAIGRVATGAGALGALAVGAGAFGALAIGALAIRALAIKRGRIERLDIGELEVGRLHVRELVVEHEQTPRQDASVSTS